MTKSKRARVMLGVMVVGALLAAACGSGRSSSSGGTDDTTGDTVASGVPTFGDLKSPCGPGSPSGAPAQGVDASSITIGYGDDAGYQASPGLGHETSDAVRALIKWCNQQGGINGRQVKGNYYDAKITEIGNVMTEACGQVFTMVGSFFALPDAAEQQRVECGLPQVPALVSGSGISNSPLMVAPVPNPIDYYDVAGAAVLAKAFPDKVKKTGVMLPNFPAVFDETQRFTGSAGTVGWEFLDCTQTFPITGVTDWRPYLQKLKDCGVEAVYNLNIGQNLQNTLDAAKQIDFNPIWYGNVTSYTSSFAAWNQNGNGNNVYFTTPVVPLDDMTPDTASTTYKELVTADGGDVAYVGQLAASAFLLWATGAQQCGNDLTRDCLMKQLRGITDWNAGGLTAPQNPGQNMVSSCANVIKVQGTGYTLFAPENPLEFVCDPSYAAKVNPPPDSVSTLKLNADRVATLYGTGPG